MIATTFRSEPVYLLHYRPNWATSPEVNFRQIADIVEGQSGTESRQAYARSMHVRFDFELLLYAQESADFRVGLQRQASANKRVLCPFWPCATNYYSGGAVYTSPSGEFYTATGSGAVYTSSTGEGCWLPTGVWLTFEPDFSTWEIHETDTPTGFTPTTAAVRVPLMLGIFEEAPAPSLDSSRLISVPIRFRETGPADMALRSVDLAFADGPTVAARTPKVFPLNPNWALPIRAGSAEVEIQRDEIGFLRAPAEVYYQQIAARSLEMGFSCGTWDETARLIAFFFQRQGMVESFWVQAPCDELELTTATSGASAVVSVDRAASLGDNRFIVLESPTASVLRHVTSVDTGANTLTLDSAPGVFAPSETRITQLILARYARYDLQVTFFTDRIAESVIRFTETPNEYFVPAGETPGTTSGALARKAYLFRFRQIFPDTVKTWRFTSYEADIIAGGETYLSRPIEHGSWIDDLDIEKSKFSLKSRLFAGNPLALFIPFGLETPLWCDLYECSPNASNISGIPTLLASGKITEARFKGPMVECEAVSPFQNLSLALPSMQIQPTCNYRLFSSSCGLSEAAWTFSGSVAAISANLLTVGSISFAGGSVPLFVPGYFAYGRLWLGTGDTYQSKGIYDSLAPAAGQVRLTLHSPIGTAPSIGSTVYFAPGCNGTNSHCLAKFGNFARFGGFPFVPPGNPTLAAVRSIPSSGGKK
jgi:hypothetical protein